MSDDEQESVGVRATNMQKIMNQVTVTFTAVSDEEACRFFDLILDSLNQGRPVEITIEGSALKVTH